ncbi:MAG: hypothetical protein M3680_35990 [Myxococcota bacterium]|nr:hypothetical protein [Myxococcota bacterium]
MKHLLLLAGSLGFAACGGGDDGPDGPSCGTLGTAELTGTVMGTQVTPVQRAHLVPTGSNYQIVIDEVAGVRCGDPGLTGEHLVLLFCDKPTATTYPVVGESTFECPGTNSYAALERSGGTEYAKATGGSITIDEVAGCVLGSYELTFGAETLSGSFDAVACQ